MLTFVYIDKFITIQMQQKTRWPSGLRRQIKAMVRRAWVQIPLSSKKIAFSVFCSFKFNCVYNIVFTFLKSFYSCIV
jgi:hypothetical protein